MSLSTSDWIAVIGVGLATVLGIVNLLKNNDRRSNQIKVKQRAGAFSKVKQKQNVNINITDD